MKENTVKFELSQATKEAIRNAHKGAYTAQALAVIEGYLVSATFKQVAKAIRDCVTDGKGWTASNDAILGGMQAARLVAIDGVKLDDVAYVANVAAAMSHAAREHAEKVAADRQKKAAEKKAAEEKAAADKAAEEKAAALRKASDLLRAKVAELESWITDAQVKLTTARDELEKALLNEAKETAQNMDTLNAFYASIDAPIPANLAELMETEAVRSDLALAKKHAEHMAEVRKARENADKAIEAEIAKMTATPAPEVVLADATDAVLKERAESMDAAIMAQSVARHACKGKKVA